MKKLISPERRKLALAVTAATLLVVGGFHVIVIGILVNQGIVSDWCSTTEINKALTAEDENPISQEIYVPTKPASQQAPSDSSDEASLASSLSEAVATSIVDPSPVWNALNLVK